MRDYEIRRGHWKHVEGEKLLHLMQDIFGEVDVKGKELVVSYGAIDRLVVQYMDKTTLRVDTTMKQGVTTDVAEETRRKFYDFLELATGYNAKERTKRLKKDVEKTDADAAEAAEKVS